MTGTERCGRRRWSLRARAGHDRGSTAAELAILVPLIAVLLGFTILAGRMATIEQDIASASRDAARAASVRQYPAQAQADATEAVSRTLASRGTSCEALSVVVDTGDLRAGGSVEATVSCTVGIGDLIGLGISAPKTIVSTSRAVVDTHRGGQP